LQHVYDDSVLYYTSLWNFGLELCTTLYSIDLKNFAKARQSWQRVVNLAYKGGR